LNRALSAARLNALTLLALVHLLIGCGQPPERVAPNVILISIDTLRADRLGAYGATTVETPAIDDLARQGVRFENAYTPVPLTLPAHFTLHTGLEPWHHGVVDNGMILAESPATTLAEFFTTAGYDTAAFVSAFVLHSTFGLDRGFSFYDDGPGADAALDQLVHASAPADERVGRAIRYLQGASQKKERPFFLWLHLFDPHAPYLPPIDFRARYGQRPYDGEVAFVDSQMGRLWAALERSGIAESTLIVLTSDHGESLGEHGEQTHGLLLYDATLRVPLIFRLPSGERAGEVRKDAATLADVAPTVLALAGLSPGPSLDGRNLFAADRSARRLGAISEAPYRRFGWASLVSLRQGGWKYITAPRPELYDLGADPLELHDLFGQERRKAVELGRGAEEIERVLRTRQAALKTTETGAEERAGLAALGYIGQTRATDSPASKLPDPKDEITTMAELDRAYQLFAEGKLDLAEASFRQLVERKGVATALAAVEGLARVARLQGRNAEAEAAYLRLLDLDPGGVSALAQLVLLAGERGEKALAVTRAKQLASLVPRQGAASRLLAEALLASGDPGAAETEWRRGLAASPHAGWLRLSYAKFLTAAGRQSDAARELAILRADERVGEEVRKAADELE